MNFSPGLCALSAMALLACSDATGSLVGGDPVTIGGGGSPGDDGGGGGGGGDAALTYISSLSAACQPGGANGGDAWQDLYLCYFGPSGVASCTFSPGNCHGGSMELGTLGSGYMCGADSTACWTSIKASLVPSGTAAAQTGLYGALRKSVSSGANNMPLSPVTLTFQDGDMSRVASWITAGAPNN
jgi:hypothetical protein